MAGLLAYLRALQSSACPTQTEMPITLATQADDVRRAGVAAAEADAATRPAVLLAARALIGRIAERLPAGAFAAERRDLAGLSRDLADAPPDARWRARFDAVIAAIAPRAAQTYDNAPTLQAALATRP